MRLWSLTVPEPAQRCALTHSSAIGRYTPAMLDSRERYQVYEFLWYVVVIMALALVALGVTLQTLDPQPARALPIGLSQPRAQR